MAQVAVSKSVLRWAVERSGKAYAIQEKFPKLDEWERGESQPTLRQIEKFAKETLTPFGYFFLPEPPEEKLPIPNFRTLGDQDRKRPSPDLLETIHTMERRQSWMREHLIKHKEQQLPFVRSVRIEDDPQQVAQKIKDTLELTESWAAEQRSWTDALAALRLKMEDAGIIVAVSGIVGNNTHRKLDPSEFRGFVLVDEYSPLVFVNGVDGKAAQMFTLAHELAHVWFGSSAAFDLRDMQPAADATEQASNRVAAEFLVPEKGLRHVWPSAKEDEEPFQVLARHFKVSALVAARRALDLGLINRTHFLKFYRDYQQDERRRGEKQEEGGNFYATQNLRIGRFFAETVVSAAREGTLLYREAYQLTGLYGKTFSEFMKRLGYGG